ncbi:MAG: caspase family protein [Thermodesulfobacteriota bacterium]
MNRALLVGINAYPTAPLRGCVNDVVDMAKFIVKRCGFNITNVRLLVDNRATKREIMSHLGWLLTGVKPGDRLFFHYSGHGAQVSTRTPQGEVDKLDEIICPVDFDWTDDSMIRDKEFHRMFKTVPEGVHFIWVSDSCHSGDLSRFMPKKGESIRAMRSPADLWWRVKTARELNLLPLSLAELARKCHLALIPGCKSSQTSADAVFNGRYNGALTYFLLKTLNEKDKRKLPLSELIPVVAERLEKAGFTQDPAVEGDSGVVGKPFFASSFV